MKLSTGKNNVEKANKKFAIEIGAISIAIASALLVYQKPYPFVFFFIGGISLLSLSFPKHITQIRLGFEYMTGKLAMINSILLLVLVYVFIVTPIALIFRLLRKDLLDLKIKDQQSYWKLPSENRSMKHQY